MLVPVGDTGEMEWARAASERPEGDFLTALERSVVMSLTVGNPGLITLLSQRFPLEAT